MSLKYELTSRACTPTGREGVDLKEWLDGMGHHAILKGQILSQGHILALACRLKSYKKISWITVRAPFAIWS